MQNYMAYLWIAELFGMFIGVLIINFFIGKFFQKLKDKASKAKEPWKKSLYSAAEKPVRAFIWLNYAFSSMFLIEAEFEIDVPDALGHVGYSIGTYLVIAWFFYTWKSKYFHHYEVKKPKEGEEIFIDKTLANALDKVSSIIILVITLVSVLESFKVSWSAIMTVIGGGTLSIGFASKDILANFFGGLMIYVNQPFKIGDWISSPEKALEGNVEEIGWYMTLVRNFDKQPIYVPNSLFPQIILVNPSRMSARGMKTVIGIRYDDMEKVEEIINKMRSMLLAHPDLHPDFSRMVHLTEFGDFSVNLTVRCFTIKIDLLSFKTIQEDILLKCWKIVEECGAEIAFPTHRVLLEKESTDASDGK